jgi:hypothetical protein
MSASFDPLTLMCVTCEKEHSVIPDDGTDLVIVVSDQNFVSCLSGKNSCVPVIRLEDPTLHELFDLTLEIFDRSALPAGTMFMVGSTSHLLEMGTTLYALDWLNMCKDFSGRWKHIKVGPLPPVLREPSCAELTKRITEVWHWFNCVYGTDISYPRAAWDVVIKTLGDNTEQNLDLATRETYRIALPMSLKSSAMTQHKFVSSASLPTTLAFSGETTRELLHALLYQLNTKIGCRAHPEDILAREPAEQEGMDTEESIKRVIICGGSISKQLANELTDMGYDIVDLSVPGWTPTPDNIDRLTSEIVGIAPGKNSIIIGDLLSNTTFCFEQLNGSLALPMKFDGRYHMLGKVTVSSKDSIHNVLSKILPVLNSSSCLKVCLPPLPRYLFSPCCASAGHCEGITEVDYSMDLLTKTLSVRKVMRDFLHSRVANLWVPDTVTHMSPEGTSLLEQSKKLESVFCADGVHLNAEGNHTLALSVKKIIDEHITAVDCVSGQRTAGEFFWRGFVSPVGSSRPKNSSSLHQSGRGGGGKWRTNFGSGRGGGRGPMGPPPPSSRRR